MTHKIKVQMFGNFRMDYNGAPFVAEKMHKESQFNRMMQALIHYSDCGIAKDKLEEIVIGERDIDAPHTALRVIVYKTKQKLAQLGLPGKNLIYLEGGIYYWTPDIEIEEDAAEFENLYNEACALEKQMPQEPESAETVCDEQTKEIEQILSEESDRLRNQTERVSLQMMKTLAATIEAKDDYMRGHSYRVAEYSALIAKQLGWSEHDVENLRNAAYLHDIGKIGVPDTILNKPTRLTDEEFAVIKSHTVMGADILKDITLLDHLVDIARNHHERYDGKGYPDGLVGEEIPLSARIVCVADSYDAMRSRRIYRNALPDEEIRRELLDNCSTQFDPQISCMFVDMLDNGMVVIDEDNPAAQGYRDNAAIESVADKFISEVMKTMSSQEKADSVDYLTGLYMRSRGQQVIAALMQDNDGCLAFIDMDNLKKVNDVHGHKAGDRALKLIGNLLAKETENETFAACRLGGDEFLIFMPYSDRASVESVIKRIFEGFESAREADCEIKEAALSAGLCMTTKGAMFESDYTKADKALYYVKQNCKGSYFFYEQLLADNKENTNLSADLRNVAKLLKESGSYTGALDLNYREFARIYEFVNNVGDRHNHNCYLVMVTMNTLPEQLADIEEIEKALDCMEQSIRSKIRKVDVCTRYSSMQYLIILFEPQENQIPNVMERIFMHYYELCDRENFKPQYEYIKMTEVK